MSFINLTVVVAALGYFVDIYDLVLFSIVRIPSLRSLGVPDSELMDVGVRLLNWQMAGLLIGGFVWGIWADKRGRVSVLFGSIFLYSMANIANAFVTDVNIYALLRFLAGFGLAGELGAAITLVSESLPKENRGLGTTLVAGIGLSGGIVAGWIGDQVIWQKAYLIGGGLGMALLLLRLSVYESGMYRKLSMQKVGRGDLVMLFGNRKRLLRYLCCVLIGVPIWYVAGILIAFSPELTRELGITGSVVAAKSVMYSYIGVALGDFCCGILSQILKSRKKAVLIFMLALIVCIAAYLTRRGVTPNEFYGLVFVLGFATGYWVIFVTVAAEHFGTNLRATVATSVPNFVRGSVIPITLGFKALSSRFGVIPGAAIVGGVTAVCALFGLYYLKETYGKDLDYLE